MFQLPYLISGGARFNVAGVIHGSGALVAQNATLSGRGTLGGHIQVGPHGEPRRRPLQAPLPVIFARGELQSQPARLQCSATISWQDYNHDLLLLLAA